MMKLVKLTKNLEKQYYDFLREWKEAGEEIIPYSVSREFSTIEEAIETFENESKGINIGDFVSSSTYVAYEEDDDCIVGAVHIRHCLNEKLLFDGGHIGDGVRPSRRNKGYATEMIKQALKICREELDLDKVLMCCYKDNIASRKSIINNGGILENEVISKKGKVVQRYWIKT